MSDVKLILRNMILDEMDKEFKIRLEQRCDDIFATIFELKTMLDVGSFREWLRRYHGLNDDNDVLVGYQFMINVLVGILINAIDSNISFGLKEDFAYHRAMHYVGLKLDKLPNTCEKAVFIKNIFELAKLLWRTESWESLKGEVESFLKSCISVFDKLLRQCISVSKKVNLDKTEVLREGAIFYSLVHLTDTHRGEPAGYTTSVFNSVNFEEVNFEELPENYTPDIPEEKFKRSKKIFYGYKYALQFLWYSLLDKEDFERFVSDMHLAEDWAPPEDIVIDENGELTNINNEGYYLDDYFGIINEKIVRAMEKRVGVRFGFDNLCIVNKRISKEDFGILLTRKPMEPKYNDKEYLNYRLYWYPAEILESKHVFNGVPAFISILSGVVRNREVMGIKEKVFVARFKHPQHTKGQNNYSYGILIEAVSNVMADYSGWIIFFDCATDYSGFGGFEYSLAEQFITLYEKAKKIDVIEIEISKENLLKYLKDSIITKDAKKIIDNWEYLQSTEKKFGEAKGMLIELLLSYILSREDYDRVEWNYQQGGIQIDVISVKGKNIHFFECKPSPPMNISDECNRFKEKASKVKESGYFLRNMNISGYKKINLSFCFWEEIPQSLRETIEKEGIGIFVLSNYLETPNPKFRRIKMDKLKFVLSKSDSNSL